ncbi:MAG TPA: hypothetical protein VMF58_12615 [Rhizomicrobium sp.]|nr:hypothetical protein [Rhizomicrobium sp.]
MQYHLFYMNTLGHARGGKTIDADNDLGALAEALSTSPGTRLIEIWEGTRFIACVGPSISVTD